MGVPKGFFRLKVRKFRFSFLSGDPPFLLNYRNDKANRAAFKTRKWEREESQLQPKQLAETCEAVVSLPRLWAPGLRPDKQMQLSFLQFGGESEKRAKEGRSIQHPISYFLRVWPRTKTLEPVGPNFSSLSASG